MFSILLYNLLLLSVGRHCDAAEGKMEQVFAWKQMGYEIDGVKYSKDSIYDRDPLVLHFPDEVEEQDYFFTQYNNVPVGLEVAGRRVFVTVPRRRYGIPSTLNYVDISSSPSPLLKPYPESGRGRALVSVYRPRVDACHRLWVVDTGLIEVPNARKQVQPPAIVVYDLETDHQILRYELKPSDLLNERTSGGLISITVDVDPSSCDDAVAYITDLATAGLIVYSMKENDSWRLDHLTFQYDESLLNFTVAGFTIPWRDNLFSVALGSDEDGRQKAFYHPLVSAQEYSLYTDDLRARRPLIPMVEGSRGPQPQAGSHGFHEGTRTLLTAAVAADGVLCWAVDTPLTPEYTVMVAQDHDRLVYISDLKVVGDEVWVLANKMPLFVYSRLDKEQHNFFIHKAKIEDLIKGTKCDTSVDERVGERRMNKKTHKINV